MSSCLESLGSEIDNPRNARAAGITDRAGAAGKGKQRLDVLPSIRIGSNEGTIPPSATAVARRARRSLRAQ